MWLLVLLVGVTFWVQRKRLTSVKELRNPALLWILGCWGSWSFLAFSLKTVSGDHALALLFVWGAAVIGITLQELAPSRAQRIFTILLCGLFLSQFFITVEWIRTSEHPRVSDHQQTVVGIIQAAKGQPYAFVYRGHLDVYDAADDHLQYLLWLHNAAPVASARQYLDSQQPELCDTWLGQNSITPAKTLTLYSPATRAKEYQETAPLIFINQTDAITVGPPPSFLCR
jgi:hypothetical protein